DQAACNRAPESGEGHRRNQGLPWRSEVRVGARFVSSGGILRGWTRLRRRIHCAKQQTGRGRNVMKFGIFYELQLPRPWEGGSEHHGKYFDIPLRNVVPKPVQKPHPPLWMACSQLPTIERAGQNGFGALGFQFVSADAAHAWVHAYYNGITKRLKKLADYEINPNMALVSFFMCAKTDEEARARADG